MKNLLLALMFCLSLPAVGGYRIIPEPMRIQEVEGVCKSPEMLTSRHDAALAGEAYRLSILPEGSTIEYGGSAGEFYAKCTLAQIRAQYGDKPVPCGVIEDEPRFSWRAIMIDPARHFIPADDVKKFIDVMAFYKFNKLHLHLTDDQGWRLPVNGYPRLESVASRRDETEGDGMPHEGMYTREELKDIVRYASERHVEVIPEIDAPGHNQALAAAYPELFCFPNKKMKVSSTPGVTKELVCPAREQVWVFYKAVFQELRDIFPSRYVHLGGDEAPEENWMACRECALWRKQGGIPDPAPLSPSAGEQDKKIYEKKMTNAVRKEMMLFFDQLGGMVRKEGKEPLFWYEAPIANYPAGSTVYTWRLGLTPATIEKAREANLKLVCSAGEHCYLDYPQFPGDTASGGRVTTLRESYSLDPGYGLPDERQKHIVGVEATLWGEHIPDIGRLFHMAYPRALALSEAGWSPMSVRSWERFSEKLEFHGELMKSQWGISLDRPEKK